MFNIGDLVTYTAHGICRIDDICSKTFSNVTRTYYVLHPIEDNRLTINCPTDSEKVIMLKMMDQNEANEIIDSFKSPGVSWIENIHQRSRTYFNTIKTGSRKDIAKIVNTLLRKKHTTEINGKKFGEVDRRLLSSVQNTLFKELAISLNSSFDAIDKQINNLINNIDNKDSIDIV